MNSNALFRHWRTADKKAAVLFKASLKDPELAPIAKQARTLADELFPLMQKKRSAEAVKADKGEILWTMFMPSKTRTGAIVGIKEVTRTPNRTLTRWLYDWRENPPTHESVESRYFNKPYEDLAKLWKEAA